ncbi:hypothetical protein BBSC_1524 [Bifidobacterium scardovii JCM 12489 = DSM 13734]|nr:hypothetical protein BBSC_1524 [Bifidobacterium scardovii JCM 12489 = DSM 13734]
MEGEVGLGHVPSDADEILSDLFVAAGFAHVSSIFPTRERHIENLYAIRLDFINTTIIIKTKHNSFRKNKHRMEKRSESSWEVRNEQC